jgi:hypothetical protein
MAQEAQRRELALASLAMVLLTKLSSQSLN